MSVDRTGRIGPRPQDLQDRTEREARTEGRAFQGTFRRNYLAIHRESESRRGRLATAHGDRIVITGLRAPEAMRHLLSLARRSPTFRRALEGALAVSDAVWITIGRGGGPSSATIGAGEERVYINLDQGDLVDLLIHECGHALAGLEDGAPGRIGPNQHFQAQVKREIEEGGAVLAYGHEVRPTAGPAREG